MKAYCKHQMRLKGLNNLDVEAVAEVENQAMIKGKNSVPLGVRQEVLDSIMGLLREEGLINKEKKYKKELEPY